jgi:hypothetical protein
MDADADYVARLNHGWIHGLEGFVDKAGIAIAARRCRCQNIQPSRSDYGSTEGNFTWINKVNAQAGSPS